MRVTATTTAFMVALGLVVGSWTTARGVQVAQAAQQAQTGQVSVLKVEGMT